MERRNVRNKWVWLALMCIIFITSNVMARDMEFMTVSIIGFVMMLGMSFVNYRYIEKYAKQMIILLEVLSVLIICTSIGTSIGGERCLNIGDCNISVISLSVLFVPLYGAYLSLCKQYIKMCICSFGLSMAILFLNIGGYNGWGFCVIPGILLCVIAYKEKSTSIEFPTPAGAWTTITKLTVGTAISSIAIPIIKNKKIMETFLSKQGEAAYIYKVLNGLLINSKLFGSGVDKGEAIAWLPEYNSTCIWTYYLSQYGILPCILLLLLLAVTMMKAIKDVKDADLTEKLIVTGAAVSVLYITIINVLKNIQLLPFVSGTSFLPFYSHGKGDIWICYILMGFILSVYQWRNA